MEYVHDGRLKRVLCGKEVILSAGALGSPHILMLSGVGQQKHLEELGVSFIDSQQLPAKSLCITEITIHFVLHFNLCS